jgi:uncharacterized coiled-coil protein SlyX
MTNLYDTPPQDVSNPIALKNFLQRTVEKISSQAETSSTTSDEVTNQAEQIAKLQSDVKSLIERVEQLEDAVIFNGRELDASYYNFNETIWSALRGYYRFSALGSALSNPPVALTGGTTYVIYAHNVTSFVGGIWQIVAIEDTGTNLRVFQRTGDTFAQAITNGWTQL